jgi:hypothetical protein
MARIVVLLLVMTFWTASGVTQQPPGPPPALPLPGGQAKEDQREDVRAQISAFYGEYWRAWEAGDLTGVANALAAEFRALQYLPSQGVVELDKSASVGGVHHFFGAIQKQEVAWNRSLLAIVPRSETEAVAAVRTDFLLPGGGETELTIEIVRKFPDGRWRLVRKWSEKSPH